MNEVLSSFLAPIVDRLLGMKRAQLVLVSAVFVALLGVALAVVAAWPALGERVTGAPVARAWPLLALGAVLLLVGGAGVLASWAMDAAVKERRARIEKALGEVEWADPAQRFALKSMRFPHGTKDMATWMVVASNGRYYPHRMSLSRTTGLVTDGIPVHVGMDSEKGREFEVWLCVVDDDEAQRELERYTDEARENWDWPGIESHDWPHACTQELFRATLVRQ